MQFVLLNLLMGGAGIAEAVITTLIVNARYAFMEYLLLTYLLR